MRILFILSTISFVCTQLTFSPKSRWSKNLSFESQDITNTDKSLPINSFEWNDMNEFLKSQLQANPLKVIQSLISLGINSPVSQFDEIPLERQSKSLQLNQIEATPSYKDDKSSMDLLADQYES